VNRTFVLMHKLTNGKVPPVHADKLDTKDNELEQAIKASKEKIETLLEGYKFREAQFELIDLARKGNRYMQEKEPWIKAKAGEAAQPEIDNCLHYCLQLCANLAILSNPFLPNTSRKMLHQMKVVERLLDWENAGKMKLLSVGYSLRSPELLFRKIEDMEIQDQIDKLKNNSQPAAATPPAAPVEPVAQPGKPTIQFDDFAKIDLKVGAILTAEKVEKADKLLKLSIDMGTETRTIVSGIALHFKPEDIIGQQVVVVANLAPRKMRGIESNGMILMAEDKEGKLHFVHPATVINPGAGVS
jgi:methionyl-tRNA synthetase